MLGVGLILQQHEFIGHQPQPLALHLTFFVKCIDHFARHRQFPVAGKKFVEIDLLLLEVHDPEAQGIGLQAGIDILGDENDLFAFFKQGVGHGQNPVVRHRHVQAAAVDILPFGNDFQDAAVIHFHALGQPAAHTKMIKIPDDLAGVAAKLVAAGFELVELLDDRHGQHHIIVGKGAD